MLRIIDFTNLEGELKSEINLDYRKFSKLLKDLHQTITPLNQKYSHLSDTKDD